MTILVSDTSVLIDLERGELIASAFKLSATFAVPDVLYERELRDYGGEDLVKLGLKSNRWTAMEWSWRCVIGKWSGA